MRSVPPRGSGWVVDGPATTSRILGFAHRYGLEQTHPLPRGGTDLIAVNHLFSNTLMEYHRVEVIDTSNENLYTVRSVQDWSEH